MARVVLLTGGARSGKSAHAQLLAEALPGPHVFVATCPRVDDEMDARIARHRAARAGRGWQTIEEPLRLAGAVRSAPGRVVVVDCISMWIGNLMMDADENGREIGEDQAAGFARELLEVCAERDGTVLFVTNEVGLGIVPDNAAARLYRDLLGRANQCIAAGARTVLFMACGLPLVLKHDGDR
jgi:adenosylcobinamide kinase / adenosylcobinamide-phosphate guanylyltransferase